MAPCLLLAAAIGVSGCEDEKHSDHPTPAPRMPARSSRCSTPTRGRRRRCFGDREPRRPAGPGGPGAPPESGVFLRERRSSSKRAARPARSRCSSDGTEPRVALAPQAGFRGEQKTTVSVAMRTGAQSALPTIDFGVVPEGRQAQKGQAGGEGQAGRRRCVARRLQGDLGGALASQPGSLPKEVATEVGKLKGSIIRYKLAKAAADVSDYSTELAKGADPGLGTALAGLVDALATFSVPAPSKPVGVGAYWMVADRTSSVGRRRAALPSLPRLEGGQEGLALHRCAAVRGRPTRSISAVHRRTFDRLSTPRGRASSSSPQGLSPNRRSSREDAGAPQVRGQAMMVQIDVTAKLSDQKGEARHTHPTTDLVLTRRRVAARAL